MWWCHCLSVTRPVRLVKWVLYSKHSHFCDHMQTSDRSKSKKTDQVSVHSSPSCELTGISARSFEFNMCAQRWIRRIVSVFFKESETLLKVSQSLCGAWTRDDQNSISLLSKQNYLDVPMQMNTCKMNERKEKDITFSQCTVHSTEQLTSFHFLLKNKLKLK